MPLEKGPTEAGEDYVPQTPANRVKHTETVTAWAEGGRQASWPIRGPVLVPVLLWEETEAASAEKVPDMRLICFVLCYE